MKDYYQILDIPENATDEEVKDAYTSAINYYKSSAIKDESLTGERIEEIEEAYRILSNTESKNEYDKKRKGVVDPKIQLTAEKKREQIFLAREERLNNDYNELKEKIEVHKREKEGFENEKLQFADQNQRIRKSIKSIRISIIVISIIALGVTISTLIYSNSIIKSIYENQISELRNTVRTHESRIVLLEDSLNIEIKGRVLMIDSLEQILSQKSETINTVNNQLAKYKSAEAAQLEKQRRATAERNRNIRYLSNNTVIKNIQEVEFLNFTWLGMMPPNLESFSIRNKTNRIVSAVDFSYVVQDRNGNPINSGDLTIPVYDRKSLSIKPGTAKEVSAGYREIHKEKDQKIIITITNVRYE